MREACTAVATLSGEVAGDCWVRRKEAERFLCLYSSNVYAGDVLCGFLRRVFLYSCSSGRSAMSTEAVFLVVFKFYSGYIQL